MGFDSPEPLSLAAKRNPVAVTLKVYGPYGRNTPYNESQSLIATESESAATNSYR